MFIYYIVLAIGKNMGVNAELAKIKTAFLRVKEDVYNNKGELQKVIGISSLQTKQVEKIIDELVEIKERLAMLENGNHNHNHNDFRLVGNGNSKLLHYSNCPYAINMNPKNMRRFEELDDGLREGYRLCNCISKSLN